MLVVAAGATDGVVVVTLYCECRCGCDYPLKPNPGPQLLLCSTRDGGCDVLAWAFDPKHGLRDRERYEGRQT